MNGVTINGKHSLDDFGLYLQPKSIPVPEPKTNYVSIQGANGQIDLSTALTDGNILYENREIELSFACIGYGDVFNAKIERFMHNVHGKIVNLVFDDDSEHYFTGRCSVTDRDYQNGYCIITCEINADPFRYDVEVTKITKTVSETATLNITNARKWVVPTITASAEMTLYYQGVMYQIPEGTRINSNIVLRDGVNVLSFTGTGNLIIEYRQGVL